MGGGPSKPSDTLTAEQIRQLSKSFDLFDKDHSGSIDYEEMEAVLASAGYGNMSKEDIALLADEMDMDGNGTIDKDEFLITMAKKSDGFAKEAKLAFQVFDKDRKGYLTAEELRDILLSIGEHVTKRQLKRLMRAARADSRGRVYYSGFSALMTASRERCRIASVKSSSTTL